MLKRRLLGLLAALTIAVLLLVVPGLLIRVGHYPTITRWPTWQQLQALLLTPDNGQVLLLLATIAGWIAWLYLVAGFLVELVARLRHIPTPRMPGFALPQMAAKSLIGAVVLMFVSLSLHATPAAAGPIHRAPATAAQIHAPQDASHTKGAGTTRYTVKVGDTLTEIAQKRLGDPDRWTDIYRASKHLNRPDGTRFTNPDLLQPGQTLIIPSTPAVKAGTNRYKVKAGDTLTEIAQKRLGDPDRWTDIYRDSKHLNRPDGTRFTDPDLLQPGQTLIIPGTPTVKKPVKPRSEHETRQSPVEEPRVPVVVVPPTTTSSPSPAPSETAPTPVPQQAAVSADEQSPVWSASLGVGTVLAAGVIGLVMWRRRLQHRRGPIGGHVPLPEGEDALAEQQLRAAADPLAIETVDHALRGLARDCATAGKPLPVVRAARLTADQFELYLAEPAHLPAPWTGTADAAVWRFEADHQADLDTADLHKVAAPYPSLVTIGKDTEDDPGLIFLDLEYLGSLGVTGGRPLTRQVIAALAIELASSPWADDLTVTIVGDYSELEGTIRSGRIVYLPTSERLIETLEKRASHDRDAMAAADVDLSTARSTGAVPDAAFPEIVMVATPLTATQRQRLTDLVTDLPRVAIAAITTDEQPLGDWHLTITGTNTGLLEPIGLAITPQMLTGAAYDRILSVIHIATHEEATLGDVAEAAVNPSPLTFVPNIDDDHAEPAEPAADAATDQPDLVEVADSQPPVIGESVPQLDDSAQVDRSDTPQTMTPSVAIVDVDQVGEAAAAETRVAAAPAGLSTAAPADASAETDLVAADLAPTAATSPVSTAADAGLGTSQIVNLEPLQASAAGVEVDPSPYIRVLGPTPDLDHVRGEADLNGRRDVSLEAIVYMALHPQATTASLDVALWPDSDNPSSTRAPALSRARRWLGVDDDGEPYIAQHTYRLSGQVSTDWARFQELTAAGVEKVGTPALEEALDLVRGRPFSGVRTQSRNPRYTWAEPIRQRMIEAITSVSHQLAQRRWLRGDWLGVEAALVRGIEVEPALEHLWRLRIRAAIKRGDATAVQEAITRMTALAETLGVEIDPETEVLLKAIRRTRILEDAR